ncbi:A24 family peptidase [Oceanicola sp. 22II-s10i]|uniref:prepilin peptidase n=1 Tax=Oceanicola sp. 22II-s10i TaxID=1317116 RepID=UPI000B52241B|nr:A24 family peptidase [Oceanicola sp. 22II-s10i]
MNKLELVATVPLIATLAALSVIDIRTKKLPDILTLPLIAAGLLLAVAGTGGWPWPHVAGAVLAFSMFWLAGEIFFRIRGIEGLGQGDAKLFAAAGAWLGWMALPAVLLIAALGGLLQAVVTRSRSDPQIAFGPWLCLGFAVCWASRLP